MIDIRQILTGLTKIIGGADYPNPKALAAAIDLDLSQARIAKSKKGNMLISEAHLRGDPIAVACGIDPWRDIWLLLDEPPLAYGDVKDEIFGASQRIQPSKFSAGFGVLCEIDGWTCGYTASSPDGHVEALFCEDAGLRGRLTTSGRSSLVSMAATEVGRQETADASIADAYRQAHISCEELWQSDLAVCGAAPIAEDPRFQATCMQRARKRYEQCKSGLALSPLLPY